MPPVQCHKPPSIVLQVLCLTDLILESICHFHWAPVSSRSCFLLTVGKYSEDGKKKWNANMAVKLFSEQKEGLLYQQNPVYAVFNCFGGGTGARKWAGVVLKASYDELTRANRESLSLGDDTDHSSLSTLPIRERDFILHFLQTSSIFMDCYRQHLSHGL